jgi:MICOS complex subunit MIC60
MHVCYHIWKLASQTTGLVEGMDVLSVSARAEFYLNEKDLDSAARGLDQLMGTTKVLLHDWFKVVRRLEVDAH